MDVAYRCKSSCDNNTSVFHMFQLALVHRLFVSLEKEASVLNHNTASDDVRLQALVDMLWAMARLGLKPGVNTPTRTSFFYQSLPPLPSPTLRPSQLGYSNGADSCAPLPDISQPGIPQKKQHKQPVPSWHPTLVERLSSLLLQLPARDADVRSRLMWALGELQMATPQWFYCLNDPHKGGIQIWRLCFRRHTEPVQVCIFRGVCCICILNTCQQHHCVPNTAPAYKICTSGANPA